VRSCNKYEIQQQVLYATASKIYLQTVFPTHSVL